MTATFYVGDAIEVMSKLPEKSVDLVLTSPPFLALRSYLPADHPDKALEGGSQATPGMFIDWLVDVVEACDRVLAPHGSLCIELGDTYAGSGGAGGDYNADGLREGQPRFKQGSAFMSRGRGGESGPIDDSDQLRPLKGATGWPLAKSLSLIPELFRLTLVYGTNPLTGRQTERWRLRNVVRWVRPNPPVGALGDKFRPATSELMVFCKSAKRYFDLDAVREPAVSIPQRFFKHAYGMRTGGDDFGETVEGRPPLLEPGVRVHPAGAPPLDWWNIPLLEGEEATRYGPKEPKPTGPGSGGKPTRRSSLNRGEPGYHTDDSRELKVLDNPLGAPPLDWWNIPPGGFSGAHYAVFPPELCVKPVKAMCPEKVCRVCGEPSRRIVGEAEYVQRRNGETRIDKGGSRRGQGLHEGNREVADGTDQSVLRVAPTLGFSDCECRLPCKHGRFEPHNWDRTWASARPEETCSGTSNESHWRPGLVLDPFGGSGTTALVATGHGRDAILIDLDERNYELALQRVGPFILDRGVL